MRPFLDMSDPAFSTRGEDVRVARDAHWCADTPYGLAVLRHRQVGQLLRDRRLRQGSYAWPRKHHLKGAFTDFWEASVISQTGADHQARRGLIVPILTDEFVSRLKPDFDQIADDLCNELRQSTSCEFMEDFAIPFAGKAIAALLGLPRDRWRSISHDASDLGLAMGVSCKSHERRINDACKRLMVLADELIDKARSGADPTGLIARMVARFDDTPDLNLDDLRNLIVISIFGGVDTTRSQLGLGIALFIDHPEQWQALRDAPELVPNAVEEMIRTRPTTTWVTREASETFAFEGETIEAGTTLHLLVHASATDPAITETRTFDVVARRKTHFGFGGGAHHCIGHLIARTDIACALSALTRTFATINYDRPAEWLPDSGNTSPVSLPIRYTTS